MKKRGFKAGTKTAKLAGLLAKYARAHSERNPKAKKEARNAIASFAGMTW